MNKNFAAMVLAIATFLQTALAQDTWIPNDDGTYTLGVDTDCSYGCTVSGVCGTKSECGAAGGGITLALIILFLIICGGCGHHHRNKWSHHGGHH